MSTLKNGKFWAGVIAAAVAYYLWRAFGSKLTGAVNKKSS